MLNDDRPLTQKLRRYLREWRGILAIAPSVAGLVLLLRGFGVLQFLEWAALDQFFHWHPPEPQDSRLVLVAMDEIDLQQERRWPISDDTLAQLIENIKAQKPRAIGLDLYRDFPVDPGYQRLAKVFASTPNLIGIEKVTGDDFRTSVAPPPVLKKLGQVGAADFLFDQDGKIRRALLSLEPKPEEVIFSLSVRLALIYLEAEGIHLEVLSEKEGKVKLNRGIFRPLDANSGGYVGLDARGYQILFNFRRSPCRDKKKPECSRFQTMPMREVLRGNIPPNFMRDRVVLIGVTAASVQDRFFTAYSDSYPTAPAGVEIHADLVSLLLSAAIDGRQPIQFLSDEWEGVWILLWSIAGTIWGWVFLRMRWKIAALILASFGLLGCTYLAFLGGWWLPLVPSLLTLIGSGVVITGYLVYVERENRMTIMNLLGQHVTPKIAQAVWQERYQLLKKGQVLGQQMTATVLFSDIQDFTSITENTAPSTLMSWLNDYMKAMSELVLASDGVLDKFIGDAVMAVFGVPIPSVTQADIARDAKAAVSCAIAMAGKVKALNHHWQQQGLPTIAIRIGIATGLVVSGSLGSRQRLNYTIIGDSVNVASRLESYDKSFDGGVCRILISEETYHYIKDVFPAHFVAVAQLKGRTTPVKIYQVVLDRD